MKIKVREDLIQVRKLVSEVEYEHDVLLFKLRDYLKRMERLLDSSHNESTAFLCHGIVKEVLKELFGDENGI